ncbi:MAG: HAD hydrolase family protein, partial [Proteobacteria bacterium]|nr:HAD hydrolase family protein [Pseudomonadota bacterium]
YDFSKIKILITDVDGVLTDAGMYYSESGDELKKFNTRDGMGIVLLKEEFSIPTAIITRERTEIVARRAKKLKIECCFQGVTDKIDTFNKLLTSLKIKPENAAYVGDDVNDLGVLKKCGFSFCPSDAEDEIKDLFLHDAAGLFCAGCQQALPLETFHDTP